MLRAKPGEYEIIKIKTEHRKFLRSLLDVLNGHPDEWSESDMIDECQRLINEREVEL